MGACRWERNRTNMYTWRDESTLSEQVSACGQCALRREGPAHCEVFFLIIREELLRQS